MLINIILLVIGFILLIKGADLFIDGATSLARNFKISKMLIGITVVALGSSAPELAISITSLMEGSGDVVIGNVIGSNITNTLLVLGICAIIHPLCLKNNTIKKELPIAMLFTALVAVLLSDKLLLNASENSLTIADGIVLLLFFLVFLYYLLALIRNKNKNIEEDEIILSKRKSILYSILGIIGILLGSKLVIDSVTDIAELLNISHRLISLTVIALGTSLPELVTSIVATKKGEYDIAVGNVIGSNIFNMGLVLGIPVVLFDGIYNIGFNGIDIIILLIVSILLFIFSYNDYKISKKEGAFLLMLFIIYYVYIFISGI